MHITILFKTIFNHFFFFFFHERRKKFGFFTCIHKKYLIRNYQCNKMFSLKRLNSLERTFKGHCESNQSLTSRFLFFNGMYLYFSRLAVLNICYSYEWNPMCAVFQFKESVMYN